MALRLGTNVDMNRVVKSLGQKYKLVPHLEKVIGEGDFVWNFDYKPKESDDAWHPSGDCTPTLRELYLKARGQAEERPFTSSLYKTFMVGHFWHQYLQWIVQHKLGFAGENDIERRASRAWGVNREWVKLANGTVLTMGMPYHWATGSGDIAPCVIPGVGTFAIDFKTMNARDFAKPTIPEYYADKWECQANIYLDFFDLEQVIFVGICKDSPHDLREWVFTRNQPLIDAIYHKWHIVSECLLDDIEPPEDEHVELPLTGPTI